MTSEIFYLTEQFAFPKPQLMSPIRRNPGDKGERSFAASQFVRGARTGKAFQGGSGTAQHYTKGGFELSYL